MIDLSARAIRRFATHILGTSSDILDEYGFTPAAFPKQQVRSLHCGFDVSQFTQDESAANASVCEEMGWPENSRIVLFVGRLDAFKNADFAIDVARAAIDKGCDLRFLVVGGGEEARMGLQESVDLSGHADRIRLVGRRLDVPRLMAASHCFLFPSLQEGLGMVAVEAQSAGLHVIASDVVSAEVVVIPELIEFLSLSAGVSAWSDALSRVVELPRADIAGANAKVAKSSFSIASSYSALHSIYAS